MTERFEKAAAWCKSHKKFWKALLMAFLPLLCCMVACALEGKQIRDVSIAAGEWNDELFYFKQVEAILHYGYPQGYFGFNESHALVGSFAAWSPVLVFPWVLWGLLFGWTLSSPVYCNIFLMAAAMFAFVWLVDPDRKQLGILTILYVVFTPLTRYMLSGMPECICFSLVILVTALDISYLKKEGTAKLVVLFLLTALMTLMRPYLILFMLLPAFFWIRKRKVWGAVGAACAMVGSLAVYALINHYLGAEYFTPLFDTEWITTFFEKGLFAGIKYFIWRLAYMGLQFGKLMWQGITDDLFYGEYFAAFIVVLLILLLQTIVHLYRFRRSTDPAEKEIEGKKLLGNGNLALCTLGMLAALLLMYKMQEGSKHLVTFIVAGIYGISLMDTRFYKKAMAAAAVFVLLFVATPVDAYEHQIPYTSAELEEREAYWAEAFAQNCELVSGETPSYENVVILVLNDQVDGTTILTDYQMLYQLPAGFGISCCTSDYVLSAFEDLKSSYLAVVAGGAVDELCAEMGAEEIGRDEALVVYSLQGGR